MSEREKKREPVIFIGKVSFFFLHLFWMGCIRSLARSANRSQVQQIYALVSPHILGAYSIYYKIKKKKKKKKSFLPGWLHLTLHSKLHQAAARASWLTIHDRQTRHLVASPFRKMCWEATSAQRSVALKR